ncbi:MAG: GHKL domain-containing protein [Bacteroidetes bacterium]|nr:GHKL domain-containing protein [Bacteroidota bacterium]
MTKKIACFTLRFGITVFIFLFYFSAHAQQGEKLIDSLIRVLPNSKEDTEKVKLLSRISQLYVGSNPKEGFKYAGAGMELAQKLQWKRGIANMNNNLGLLTGDTGNNQGARVYFEKSFAINKEMNAQAFMLANMNNIGRSYQRETNFTKASEYYFKAMAIADESGNNEQAALLGTNITSLYIIQKDYSKAAEYAAITIKKGEAANAMIHVAKAYELLGVINLETNDFASAKKNLEKALSIDEKLGNKMAAVGVLSNIGSAETDPKKAIDIFLKIQQILDSAAPASQNSILNLLNLGLNYYNLGMSESGNARNIDFEKSEGFLKRAEVLCKSTNNPEYEADARQTMSTLQESRGNYKEALQDYKSFVAINDSIFSQDNKNKIAALESQHAIDLKNKQIENKQLQIVNQQNKIWLLVSLVAFFVTLGILIYRQSLSRKKTNTVLVKLNSELDEANKIKAKFFAILSHDLRSPVANLINFLRLQKNKPDLLTQEQVRFREKKITTSAESLLETMDVMLLWSKGQMEHFAPKITESSVDNLFAYIQKFFSATDNIHFSFSNPESITVTTDENFLRAIMQNLTANSIKALNQVSDAAIEWKAWKENGRIFLSITDNGPGITTEQAKSLFDETNITGTINGLGLHIIRDLAKAIHCNITIAKTNNTGASFILSI